MNSIFWFGTIIAVLGACVSVPQTVRVLRHRDINGLSITSYTAWALSWALWAVYSAEAGAWPKAASEALGLVMESALLITLVLVVGRTGGLGLIKGFAYAIPGLVGIAAAGLMWGPVGFAVALTVFDAVYLIPQVRAVMTASSLSGLSLWSYGLRCITATGWIFYAFMLGRPEVGGWGYIIAPFCVFVIVRVLMSRRQEGHPAKHETRPVLLDPAVVV